MQFRDEKKLKEGDLKKQMQDLRLVNDQLKREKDIEVQHLKLINETERLSLKSEYEVKCDYYKGEHSRMKEEQKKIQTFLSDLSKQYEKDSREYQNQIDGLKNELLIVKREK